MATSKITEIGVTFYKAGGHNHDGITSSLIDTSKYSIFDFNLGVSTEGTDANRESARESNRSRFDQYVTRLVTSQVLEPAGIVLPPDSVRGVNIGANEITANNIAANTITADQIAANTITANQIAANTITADQIAANAITASEIAVGVITSDRLVADFAVVNNTIRSNNFSYNPTTGTGTGWAIYGNGNAIFVDGTFTGKLDIGGFDSTSFHVNSSGDMWSGAATLGTFGSGAPIQILSSGNVSLAYGALQAFNNSVVRCNASLISFTGGSGTTLVVDGSISSYYNIVASGNVRADSGQISASTGYITNTLSALSSRISFIDRDGLAGVTQALFKRTSIGSSSYAASSADDQILQVWNSADVGLSKPNVAGIAFACGPSGSTTAAVLRFYSQSGTAQAIANVYSNNTIAYGVAGSGSGLDVGNASGTGFGYMGASAFVIRSSQNFKTDIEYMPQISRSKSIDRIRNLKPARWNDKFGYEEGTLTEKFIDINNRWTAKGRTPLIPRLRDHDFKKHDCKDSDCIKNEEGFCENYKFYQNRYGFIAEDVAEVFPKAVQSDVFGNPIGIDYAVITYSLVETVQELLDKIDILEDKLSKLES